MDLFFGAVVEGSRTDEVDNIRYNEDGQAEDRKVKGISLEAIDLSYPCCSSLLWFIWEHSSPVLSFTNENLSDGSGLQC